jgi:hypothetical protein
VSVEEIEEAERALLEGLDFRLRCHHPYGAIKVLASDIIYHIMEGMGQCSDYSRADSKHGGYQSPRSVTYYGAQSGLRLGTVCDRALAVAQAALVYSDVCFIFPPGQIAFAAVAIAVEGRVGRTMHEYLKKRFPQKTREECDHFEDEVTRIVALVANCPSIDMNKFSSPMQRKSRRTTAHQAAQIRRAFSLAADIRGGVDTDVWSANPRFLAGNRKRKELFSEDRLNLGHCFKVARVTPNHTPF